MTALCTHRCHLQIAAGASTSEVSVHVASLQSCDCLTGHTIGYELTHFGQTRLC